MCSTESCNIEHLQNNLVSQNFATRFVSLKNDNSSPLRYENNFMTKMMNTINQVSSKPSKNPNVMKKPRNTDQELLDFFLFQFKCSPCQFRKGTCQDKATCEGWHHEGERRRHPGTGPNFYYSEEPCPKLKTPGTNKWAKPVNCKNGDSCPFSHTLMEQMYHPNIYKTSLCTNFTANCGDQCQWGYFCTHAHGQKDIRNLNKKDITKSPIRNNNIPQIPIPKLVYNITSADISSSDNDNLTYLEQQVTESQHSSDNGSPSHSYQTPLYQPIIAPLNAINTPSTKYSSVTPSGSIIGQSTKASQLLLPTPASYYQSQVSSHAITPNTMTYEQTYYNGFQTFPNPLRNEKQQYSWDINSNDVTNLQQSPSTYTPINNISRSPPPIAITPFDVCNTNNNNIIINNTNNTSNGNNGTINLSPNHGAKLYITSTEATNLISQRPIQLPRANSINIPLPNPKLQATISSKSANLDQPIHHLTPQCNVGQIRYLHSTSTYQPCTSQLQAVDIQTTNIVPYDHINIDSDICSPTEQNSIDNTFNTNTFQSIQSTLPSVQETTSSRIQNIGHNSLAKETRTNMSYYFLGDDSLLSPTSNKPDGLTKTPPPPRASVDIITNKDHEEIIITQLKAQINQLKKELEVEKEKNKKTENFNNSNDNHTTENVQAIKEYPQKLNV